MSQGADLATITGAVIAVVGVILTVMKLWIEKITRDTKQLQHNGGSHVADYARDARDESRKTNERLDSFIFESAKKESAQDAQIELLTRIMNKS